MNIKETGAHLDRIYMPIYTASYQSLKTWRSRYSKFEYPEKVMINTFYLQYIVNYLWEDIMATFIPNVRTMFTSDVVNKQIIEKKFQDYKSARLRVDEIFDEIKLNVIHPQLKQLLANNTDVGSLDVRNFNQLIVESRSGNHGSTEELEYRYLYYKLSNEGILTWAACGLAGLDPERALYEATGCIFGFSNFDEATISFGKLLADGFLARNYVKLDSY